jgi:hypothetical protein
LAGRLKKLMLTGDQAVATDDRLDGTVHAVHRPAESLGHQSGAGFQSDMADRAGELPAVESLGGEPVSGLGD